jgi:phospholipase C
MYHPIFRLVIACFCCYFPLSAKHDAVIKKTSHDPCTTTPIKHLVIIFGENRSFDNFFATYPQALNPPGEPHFKAKRNTPTVNNLLSRGLINHNTNVVAPFRLSRSQAATTNPAHDYTALQKQANGGLMDQFVQVNNGDITPMGYYDGNTVTALWNYAQQYAMSDNFHSTTFTPSTPGAINLISGQTHGAIPADLSFKGRTITVDGTLINDIDPTFDKCSIPPTVQMTGLNVGDLLNQKKITWGWFQGGFNDCKKTHIGSDGIPTRDYILHHAAFQYYQSTSNPQHLPPTSVDMIGRQDQANHQYDLDDFWAAVKNGNQPAVSFLKPAAYQDCHTGYSDPLAFQTFVVETINALLKTPEWRHMAIMIAFDDSGGLYQHELSPIIQQSNTSADNLLGSGNSGTPAAGTYNGRLAYGLTIPLIIISPYAKKNYVDHLLTDQTSILRFIEDNWRLGQIGDQSFDQQAGSLLNLFDFKGKRNKRLFLDPNTGTVIPPRFRLRTA